MKEDCLDKLLGQFEDKLSITKLVIAGVSAQLKENNFLEESYGLEQGVRELYESAENLAGTLNSYLSEKKNEK